MLRFTALGQDVRLHPDEALFATFARGAALNGEWLLPGPLDKPPLSIYSTALSMALLVDGEAAPGLPDISPHRGEFAARLPNVWASLVAAALVYRLAWLLYRRRQVALLTLALVAFSPYSTAFAATALTDGWLLLWGVAALTAMASGQWGWAGVWFGLALWSKPQALFFLPLIVMMGWLLDGRPGLLRRGLAFILPVGVALGLLLAWDEARGQADSLWVLAAANNDPWRLLRSGEVWPRLQMVLGQAGWLLGPPLVTLTLAAVGIAVGLLRVLRWPGRRGSAIDLLLGTFVLGYGGLHWLTAFNLYDRYWLLLLVPLALLVARGVDGLLHRCTVRYLRRSPERNPLTGEELKGARQTLKRTAEPQRTQSGAEKIHQTTPRCSASSAALRFFSLSLLVAGLLWGGWLGATGRAPVGGDRGQHDGIDEAAAFLDSRALGAIIYDYWLGWELDYYLGEWTDKRRVYYPSTAALVEDALRQPDPAPRYFIAPAQTPHRLWLDALEAAGFGVTVVYRDGFIIYELVPF